MKVKFDELGQSATQVNLACAVTEYTLYCYQIIIIIQFKASKAEHSQLYNIWCECNVSSVADNSQRNKIAVELILIQNVVIL